MTLSACVDGVSTKSIHASSFIIDPKAPPILQSEYIYDEQEPPLRASGFYYPNP